MYLQRPDRSGGPREWTLAHSPSSSLCHRRASPRGSPHPLLALPGISPPPPRIIHLLFSVLVIPFLIGPLYHSSCLFLSISFLHSFAFSSSLSHQLVVLSLSSSPCPSCFLIASSLLPSKRSNVLVALKLQHTAAILHT